jgi:hypothetical protein
MRGTVPSLMMNSELVTEAARTTRNANVADGIRKATRSTCSRTPTDSMRTQVV